jgi:beta-lactamase superfamily II metal-dependent hydrolase
MDSPSVTTRISAGEENPYGHPGPALLARLQDAGVCVYRTDQDGTVIAMRGLTAARKSGAVEFLLP